MAKINDIELGEIVALSEVERLAVVFQKVSDRAIENYQKELEVAQAMGDEQGKRMCQLQIGMMRHAQGMFHFAKQYALDGRWQHDKANR